MKILQVHKNINLTHLSAQGAALILIGDFVATFMWVISTSIAWMQTPKY